MSFDDPGNFSELTALFNLRNENKRLRDQLEGRRPDGPNGSSSRPGPSSSPTTQIGVALFLLMLTSIVGVIWIRGERHDDRIRELEISVAKAEDNKRRIDWLYERLYGERR